MREVKEATAARLGELIRRSTPARSAQAHWEGRARLVSSIARAPGDRRRKIGIAFVLLAAAVATAAIVLRRQTTAPVAWHVEGASLEAQGYVSVARSGPGARLVFDDGSQVALDPGARGRVGDTTARGADVVLEQGRARVHVQHRERTSWTIDAGPYAVHVTGTDFVVGWAADAETLDVWMRTGRVLVTGPALGDELSLSAGQHLTAMLRDKTSRIDAEPETPVAPTAPVVALGHETVEAPAGSSASPSPTSRPPMSDPSWARRVAAGDHARVVRDAEAEGLDRVLGSRPLADLRALGDAARYAGRSDLAKRAYVAVRERFPSTTEAHTAAFLLGRLAEEQDGDSEGALRWYDAYFTEAPAGAFAGDALGRKMILVCRTQGRLAARPLAREYLRRFSSGTYSAAARDLDP